MTAIVMTAAVTDGADCGRPDRRQGPAQLVRRLAGRHPLAAVVERSLARVPRGSAIVVAASGGADSTALAIVTTAIAREKAGIFKKGVPAISVEQEPAVARVFDEVAAATATPPRPPSGQRAGSRTPSPEGHRA